MSENILVPVLGESISEATVSKWLKKEGDRVDADEPIVELETDKVNLEVPSPVSGVLTKIVSKDGNFASSLKNICPKDCLTNSPTLNCLCEKGAVSFCLIIKFFFLFL